MCNVKPGPRCSDHAYAKLMTIKKRIHKTKNDIRSLDILLEDSPNSEEVERDRALLKRDLSKMVEELDYRTLLYDSTPEGQANLGRLINNTSETQEKARLEKRLILASRLRRKQVAAMEVVKSARKKLGDVEEAYDKEDLRKYLSLYKRNRKRLIALDEEKAELSLKLKNHSESYSILLKEVIESKSKLESEVYKAFNSAGLDPKSSLDYTQECLNGFIGGYRRIKGFRIPILGGIKTSNFLNTEGFNSLTPMIDRLEGQIRIYNVAAEQYKQIYEKRQKVSSRRVNALEKLELYKELSLKERRNYQHFVGSKIRGLPLDNVFRKSYPLRSQLTPKSRLYVLVDYQGMKIFMKVDEYVTMNNKDFVFLESGERLAVRDIPLDDIKILPT